MPYITQRRHSCNVPLADLEHKEIGTEWYCEICLKIWYITYTSFEAVGIRITTSDLVWMSTDRKYNKADYEEVES